MASRNTPEITLETLSGRFHKDKVALAERSGDPAIIQGAKDAIYASMRRKAVKAYGEDFAGCPIVVEEESD